MKGPLYILTVDLEEWFVVDALHTLYSRDKWDDLPTTVVANTRRLLRLFDQKNAVATFFILGS